jgi:hypothetical protein
MSVRMADIFVSSAKSDRDRAIDWAMAITAALRARARDHREGARTRPSRAGAAAKIAALA